MRFSLRLLSILGFLLASVTVSVAQYGGYGGGYGGYGGMGRSMGGMGGGQMGSSKPPIPNIAGDIANKETKWLKETLALTKDQQKAVKTLNSDYGKQQQDAIKEIINAAGAKPGPQTSQQIRDAMMMYNEEKEDKLHALLTPEQWATYQTRRADMQRDTGGGWTSKPKRDSTLTTAGGRP